MKIVQITAVQSNSDRADHIVYGLDENGEMWRSENGHNSWEYMSGLPKESVVLPDVIPVSNPLRTALIEIALILDSEDMNVNSKDFKLWQIANNALKD